MRSNREIVGIQLVEISCALRSHDDMAIAAAKNFSGQPRIILVEGEKGNHVSKEWKL